MISDRGPSISENEIRALEERIGVELPIDYREFLLSQNGGRPEPDGIEVPGFDETDVQILFGVGRKTESSCIEWNLNILKTRLPVHAIPIASDSGGNVFFISLEKQDCGSVFYADLNAVYGNENKKAPAYKVDSTFMGFISNLFE